MKISDIPNAFVVVVKDLEAKGLLNEETCLRYSYDFHIDYGKKHTLSAEDTGHIVDNDDVIMLTSLKFSKLLSQPGTVNRMGKVNDAILDLLFSDFILEKGLTLAFGHIYFVGPNRKLWFLKPAAQVSPDIAKLH